MHPSTAVLELLRSCSGGGGGGVKRDKVKVEFIDTISINCKSLCHLKKFANLCSFPYFPIIEEFWTDIRKACAAPRLRLQKRSQPKPNDL